MARRAKGDGTIRHRKDGRWEARYTAGRDPGTGKQIQKSIICKTQDEVRRKLKEVTKTIDDGTYTEPTKLTLGQWLDIWLKDYLTGVKPNTVSSYESKCRLHIKPYLGAIRLTELSSHGVQQFINSLSRDKGLSPKTIKCVHGCLHMALQEAVNMKPVSYLTYNPASGCKLPDVTKPEIKPLDEDAISMLMSAIKGHKWETLYTFTLFSGMRRGEVLGLSWEQIDFKNGSILICQQLQFNRQTKEYELITLKNNKNRRIVPAPFIMQQLKAHRKIQQKAAQKAGQLWTDTGLVFTDELGHHLYPETVRKTFKRIASGLGIPKARFHDLRHSYAVVSLASGVDIKTLQQNMGHHSAAFTLDTYADATDKMKRDAADKMEKFYRDLESA